MICLSPVQKEHVKRKVLDLPRIMSFALKGKLTQYEPDFRWFLYKMYRAYFLLTHIYIERNLLYNIRLHFIEYFSILSAIPHRWKLLIRGIGKLF
jgi:hypothetical protein